MSRTPSSSVLVAALAGLLFAGCASTETPPETPPPATQPSPTNLRAEEDTPEPEAPPLGHPRPKVGPGSVILEEDRGVPR